MKTNKIAHYVPKTHQLNIYSLTQMLQSSYFSPNSWEETQDKFQDVINTLSQCIEEMCINIYIPLPYPTDHTNKAIFTLVNNRKLEKPTPNIP